MRLGDTISRLFTTVFRIELQLVGRPLVGVRLELSSLEKKRNNRTSSDAIFQMLKSVSIYLLFPDTFFTALDC
jgi:hypothetical protein